MPSLASALQKARNRMITMFLALLILDAILIFLSKDLWAIGRIIFTAAIMYLVVEGHHWAKWMLVSILSLVVVALVGLLTALSNQLDTLIVFGSLIMIVLCCVIMAYLVGNHDLKKYFAVKQQSKS